MSIWVINFYDGSIFGAYGHEDTAWYALQSAPGTCLEPQKVEVLIT